MSQQENIEYAKTSSPISKSCQMNRRLITLITVIWAIHIISLAYIDSGYLTQIEIGEINFFGPLVGAVSNLVLLIGVVLLNTKRCFPLLFLIAAVGFVLAAFLLWIQFLPYYVSSFILSTYGVGVAISVFSWWAIMRHKKKMQSE